MLPTSGKLKVVFLLESLNVGGAEKALLSILHMLDYDRFDVTLKLISRSGAFLAELENLPKVRVKAFSTPSPRMLGSLIEKARLKAIYRWLPARYTGNGLCSNCDVAVAFCEGNLTRWVAASTHKCRKIAWVHTDMVNNDWPVHTGVFKSESEEAKAYRKFDAIVGVSELVSEGVRHKFGSDRITTIYNILDPQLHEKADEKIEIERRRTLNLIGVGRLERVKGFDRLIEAMNVLVNDRQLDISLTIVGDGSQRDILLHLVDRYKLHNHVYLAGASSNPYPYIRHADMLVCPSRQEGFNIAILEAMTLGKAIISTDCAGPREILQSGRYGLLTDNSTDGLVEAIYSIYSDPQQLARYTELATRRCTDFAAETQMELIYRQLTDI